MALNLKRFAALRDLLDKTHDEDFDMSNWLRRPDGRTFGYASSAKPVGWTCGTSACLAGHVVMNLMTNEEVDNAVATSFAYVASDWLGMSGRDVDSLFKGGGNSEYMAVALSTITKKEAIKALDYIIKNGKIPEGIFPLIKAGKI